jgi:hypothetical protein
MVNIQCHDTDFQKDKEKSVYDTSTTLTIRRTNKMLSFLLEKKNAFMIKENGKLGTGLITK